MNAYKSFFVDTNIFITAYRRADHNKTRQCQAFIRSIKQGEYDGVISELVLAEFVWTLKTSFHAPKQEIVALASSIRDVCSVPAVRPDMGLALDLFSKHSVKLVDAIIASYDIVQKGPLPIVSYDKDFDKMSIERIEPGDLIA